MRSMAIATGTHELKGQHSITCPILGHTAKTLLCKSFHCLQLQRPVLGHRAQSSRKQGISSPAVLSHHRAYRSVHGGSLSFEPNLLVNRFLEVIFSHPAKSPPSHIAFGCRPILLWPGLQIIEDFLRSTFHKVTFIHLLKLKVQPFPS